MIVNFKKIRVFLVSLIIITIPLGSIKVIWPQLNLPTFLFFLYLVVFIFRTPTDFHNKNVLKQFLLLLLIYALIFSISFLNFVKGYPGGYSFLRQLPIYIFYFYFISNEIITGNIKPQQYMQWFIWSAMLLAVLFVLGVNVSYEQGSRLEVMSLNSNFTAILTATAIVLMIHQVSKLKLKRWKKAVYFIFFPVLLYMTIITGSRGGFIALALSLLIYTFFQNRGFINKSKNLFKGILLVGAISIIFLSNDLMYSRFFEDETSVLESRTPIWENVLIIAKGNLIFGVGIFRYQSEMTKLRGGLISIHNEYLSILVYSGIIGLSLFLFFLFRIAKSAYLQYINKGNPVYLSLLAIVLFNLFKGGGTILSLFTWVILTLVYASWFADPKEEQKRNNMQI